MTSCVFDFTISSLESVACDLKLLLKYLLTKQPDAVCSVWVSSNFTMLSFVDFVLMIYIFSFFWL